MPRHSVLRLSSSISGKENDKTSLSPSSPSGCVHARGSCNRSASAVSLVNRTSPPLLPRRSRRRSANLSFPCEHAFARNARSQHKSRNSGSERCNAVSRAPLLSPRTLYNTATLTLPRQLPRHPAIVTSEKLATLDGRLKGIPVEFLHSRLREMSPLLVSPIFSVQHTALTTNVLRLQQGLTAIGNGVGQQSSDPSTGSPTSSEGPKISVRGDKSRYIEVVLNHATGKLPTHVLAIIGSSSAGYIYPIHGILYAVHCATFPFPEGSLSASDPEPRRSPTNHRLTLSLPLVTLKVPHLESFSAINTFLYTENPVSLLIFLLPIPHALLNMSLPNRTLDMVVMQATLSAHIATTYNPSVLIDSARKTHGLWSNLIALGIAHQELWKLVDLAWEVLLMSMEIQMQRMS